MYAYQKHCYRKKIAIGSYDPIVKKNEAGVRKKDVWEASSFSEHASPYCALSIRPFC
jgi:hypothetical protein